MEEKNPQVAIFFDYDNQKVDPRIIFDYTENFGWIVKKRAYGDWVRDAVYRAEMSSYYVELIDRPRFNLSDKQGNDISITVDAMELAFSKPNIGVFVFVTGDSDFIPLVLKLKEFGKTVNIISSKNNTSLMLARVCDNFTFYENLVKSEEPPPLDHRDYFMLLARKAFGIIKNRGARPSRDNLISAIKHFDPSFKLEKTGFKNVDAFVKAIESTWSENGAARREATVQMSGASDVQTGETHSEVEFSRSDNGSNGHAVPKNPGVVNFFVQLFEKLDLADKNVTLEKARKLFTKNFPNVKFEKYGYKDFVDALKSSCGSKFELKNNLLSYTRRYQIERGLRKMGIFIPPRMKDAIVKSFITVYVNFKDTGKRTLNYLAREVYENNRHTFSKTLIANIFTALKFTGVFEGADASSYITYSQPMKINCPMEELENRLDLLYLKRIIKITPIAAADFKLVSEFIFAVQPENDKIEKMLDTLIGLNEIVLKNGSYYYKENIE